MASKRGDYEPMVAPTEEVGYYEAFDRDGNVIFDCEGFVAGRSTIPPGLSIGMVAMRITDPKTKRVIRKWDPWGLLAGFTEG